jgi:hypothetical protein
LVVAEILFPSFERVKVVSLRQTDLRIGLDGHEAIALPSYAEAALDGSEKIEIMS